MSKKQDDKFIADVIRFREEYGKYSDGELAKETARLRDQKPDGNRERIFALVSEATRRVTGKTHYPVQILAGLSLIKGHIAEAKTGEGKTISIYFPAFYHALAGKGVHIVTTNDYLARRDAEAASEVFRILGMTVGCVTHDTPPSEHGREYMCHITYVSNSELGFDYLRSNMAFLANERIVRPFYAAIIDEADSVLIDDARTPLIISGREQGVSPLITETQKVVGEMEEGAEDQQTMLQMVAGRKKKETGDFVCDRAKKTAALTQQGIDRIEAVFGEGEFTRNCLLMRAVNNALRANFIMSNGRDYVVSNGCVEIVDEFTGRVLKGRRFTDGLHQAIEAKEGVEIHPETVTAATITYQSLFNLYPNKCGLTGTARGAENEFRDVYGMEIEVIPTNRPVIRQDLGDDIYRTRLLKWQAVVKTADETRKKGQPVLIGTTSVEDSEMLSVLFTQLGVPHEVLNARNEAREAEIIAGAGRSGQVTIATNMAGRGTDIKLDDDARKAGGLYVIGTERHDSSRIDAQLIGRSGRQGDPGCSRFILSLEDRLLTDNTATQFMEHLAEAAGTADGPIPKYITGNITDRAQKKVEKMHYLTRMQLVDYDRTDSAARNEMYRQRDSIIDCPDGELETLFHVKFMAVSDELAEKAEKIFPASISGEKLAELFGMYYQVFGYIDVHMDGAVLDRRDIREVFRQVTDTIFRLKTDALKNVEGNEQYITDARYLVMRVCMMRALGKAWTDYLAFMEQAMISAGLEAYSGRKSADIYAEKGVEAFNRMLETAGRDAVKNYLTCSVSGTVG